MSRKLISRHPQDQRRCRQILRAVSVHAEGDLVRTGTLKGIHFREPVKFQTEFLFIRNPDLLGNGRRPLVVQDFKYTEAPL